MKQGRASSSVLGSQKVEPKPHAINVGAVSELGIHQVHTSRMPGLDAGRGYKAPMGGGRTIHYCGSQGKH